MKTKDFLADVPEEQLASVREWDHPGFITPMLATLADDYFSSPDWIYERKFDGERAIASIESGNVSLWSRNEKKLNDTYPDLVEALEEACDGDMIIDGEIVAFVDNVTSFARLQQRMHVKSAAKARKSGIAVYFYVFDMPWREGLDLTGLPLRTRKSLLRAAVDFNDRVRLTDYRNEDGIKFLKEACENGWEGLIAKRADSTYVRARSRNWLKYKCVNRQEFVIGGYTEPCGERKGFGALLIGYYEGESLVYAGKVGTGFDEELLKSLHKRMRSLERQTSPFNETPKIDAHWLTPKLVGEVAFTEWTDGKLRHPRFVGLRRDKDARDVVREEPT